MMTKNEFLKQWPTFLKAFDKAFNTPELRARIQAQVDAALPKGSYEEKVNAFANAYQTARTDNLIKAVIQNFVTFDDEDKEKK